MTYDPLTDVTDEPLPIDATVLESLRFFRAEEKFVHLPGLNVEAERARLTAALHQLTDELLKGVAANPSKLWVLSQFQACLQNVQQEDTEAREHFGAALESLMDILGIESSDGLLDFYLSAF